MPTVHRERHGLRGQMSLNPEGVYRKMKTMKAAPPARRRRVDSFCARPAAVVLPVLLSLSADALAVTPVNVLGSGSDVMFHVWSALDLLYNESPGCTTIDPTLPAASHRPVRPQPGDITTENLSTTASPSSGRSAAAPASPSSATRACPESPRSTTCARPAPRRQRLQGPELRGVRPRCAHVRDLPGRDRPVPARRQPVGCLRGLDRSVPDPGTAAGHLRQLHDHQLERGRRCLCPDQDLHDPAAVRHS